MHTSLSRIVAASIALVLIALVACGTSASSTVAANQPLDLPSPPTTIFLVRHAEKGSAPAQDPPLSPAGRTRAEALARMLAPSGIDAIYTSQFARTKETAEPLAARIGVPSVVVPIGSDGSMQPLVEKINEQTGKQILVVGHSNTVPAVIKALGAEPVPTIDESEYDNLYIMTLHGDGRATVVRMKYGETR